MDVKPIDFTNNEDVRNLTIQTRNNNFQSPLLKANSVANDVDEKRGIVSNQGNPNHMSRRIYNRLGQRNDGDNNEGRNFNRKRDVDGNSGPMTSKRKWRNQRNPYFQKPGNFYNNSVQSRLNRIRTNVQQTDSLSQLEQHGRFIEPSPPERHTRFVEPEVNQNESELDEDITVQVINNNVQPRENTNPVRFKMQLDPQKQAAIRNIQLKMKERQVIFPYPVTPNKTEISLHDRFSML